MSAANVVEPVVTLTPVNPSRVTHSTRDRTSGALNANRNRGSQAGPPPWLHALHALRLQWPWVVLCGVPLSVLLAYTAWTTIPSPYTAYAELLCQPRRFFWETKEDDPNFEVYKQTTMRRLKDPQVLNAAVSDPDVQKTKYFRESPAEVLDKLTRDLNVGSPAQEFIRLELKGENPQELATILDAVVNAFKTVVVDREQESRKARLEELKTLWDAEVAKLNREKSVLRGMDDRMEAADAEQRTLKRQKQIDLQLQIRKEMSVLHPQIIELGLLLKDREDEPAASDPTIEAVVTKIPPEELESLLLKDRTYAKSARQLAGLQLMLDEWKRRVSEPHPEITRLTMEMQQANEQLDKRRTELEPAIVAALEQSVASNGVGTPGPTGTRAQMAERLKLMQALLDKYDEELVRLQKEESTQAKETVTREALAEEVDSLKETAGIYEEEVRRRQVELDNAPPPISVSQKATTPLKPDQRKRYIGTMAGAGGGVGLVAALILLIELGLQRVSDNAQLRSKTNVPVLGAVPMVPFSFRTARTAKQKLTANYWRDVLREAFDGIQSILRHNQRCADARVVMVASSSEAEGKTTSATHLALSFARSGYRVLLIDGDLRRPTVDKEFGLSVKTGLCEVVEGALSLDQAIVHTDLAELDLLPAGHLTDKCRGLLARDAHEPIFQELAERYNFVFIDSAPVLLTADTMSLAKHVDGVLMIVRKDVTRLRRLEAALHRFDMIGVPMLGLLTIGLGDSSSLYSYNYNSYAGMPSRALERSPEDVVDAGKLVPV
jgi:succinoglycan biosynthesis transport protein ExoP